VIFVTHILGHGREHRPTAVVLAEIHRVGTTIVVFGHTHRQACWLAGGITYVNPGSVSEGRGGPRSLAILELASDRIDIRFFGLDGRELEVLPGA
jgi:predicted phosphodiesterase